MMFRVVTVWHSWKDHKQFKHELKSEPMTQDEARYLYAVLWHAMSAENRTLPYSNSFMPSDRELRIEQSVGGKWTAHWEKVPT